MSSQAEEDWADVIAEFTDVTGVSNCNVTLRSLSLGVRDTITGWRAKSFSESTIEMIIISRGANAMHLIPGLYAQTDAVGRTRNETINMGDEVKTAADVYYEVKVIHDIHIGDLLWHRDCDLAELPLHE